MVKVVFRSSLVMKSGVRFVRTSKPAVCGHCVQHELIRPARRVGPDAYWICGCESLVGRQGGLFVIILFLLYRPTALLLATQVGHSPRGVIGREHGGHCWGCRCLGNDWSSLHQLTLRGRPERAPGLLLSVTADRHRNCKKAGIGWSTRKSNLHCMDSFPGESLSLPSNPMHSQVALLHLPLPSLPRLGLWMDDVCMQHDALLEAEVLSAQSRLAIV